MLYSVPADTQTSTSSCVSNIQKLEPPLWQCGGKTVSSGDKAKKLAAGVFYGTCSRWSSTRNTSAEASTSLACENADLQPEEDINFPPRATEDFNLGATSAASTCQKPMLRLPASAARVGEQFGSHRPHVLYPNRLLRVHRNSCATKKDSRWSSGRKWTAVIKYVGMV